MVLLAEGFPGDVVAVFFFGEGWVGVAFPSEVSKADFFWGDLANGEVEGVCSEECVLVGDDDFGFAVEALGVVGDGVLDVFDA